MSDTNLPTDQDVDLTTQKNSEPDGAGEGGDGQKPPIDKAVSVDAIPDEYQHIVNALMASARRAGEAKGKKTAEQELESRKSAEELNELKDKNDYQALSAQFEKRATDAEAKVAEIERKFNALIVSVEKAIPNPLLVYQRIVGDTKEEMEADADSLLAFIKGVVPEKKKADEDPPIAPKGGKNPEDKNEGKVDEAFEAQAKSYIYNV